MRKPHPIYRESREFGFNSDAAIGHFANEFRPLAAILLRVNHIRQEAAPLTGLQTIDMAMIRSLSRASDGPVGDYMAQARLTLERLVAAPRLLDLANLDRTRGGYARNLLFGDDAMSLWAMVWDVGARTSVHDHHCSCCFGVLVGALREVRFKAVDEHTATMTGQEIRTSGFVDCLLPSGPNLHQMINDGASEAVSLHIYGYDHRLQSSSVRRAYRIVTQ